MQRSLICAPQREVSPVGDDFASGEPLACCSESCILLKGLHPLRLRVLLLEKPKGAPEFIRLILDAMRQDSHSSAQVGLCCRL